MKQLYKKAQHSKQLSTVHLSQRGLTFNYKGERYIYMKSKDENLREIYLIGVLTHDKFMKSHKVTGVRELIEEVKQHNHDLARYGFKTFYNADLL